MRLLKHIKFTADLKTVEAWLGNQTGNWISFWPFFTVTVEKCLAARTSQVMSRAVQALYIEIVDEVRILCEHLMLFSFVASYAMYIIQN